MKRAALVTVLLLVSCGGDYSSPPTSPPPANNPFTFTITASGVTPKELAVPPGTRVLFVNNDTRRRNMTSDPHPEHR
jgi:plastocyanin